MESQDLIDQHNMYITFTTATQILVSTGDPCLWCYHLHLLENACNLLIELGQYC